MPDLQHQFGLDTFSGTLPLFPLPGVVLFPCTLLPLHIFEPRYRAMLDEAVERDGCIGMVLLRPGWEKNYHGNPPVHDVACLGKVVERRRLADGRCDIVLCGVKRARIEGTIREHPFRTARVTLLEEHPIDGRPELAESLRQRIFTAAESMPAETFRHRNFGAALRRLDAPLGCSSDLVADSMLLPAAKKQEILEELDPIARASALLRALGEREDPVLASLLRRYPPAMSMN